MVTALECASWGVHVAGLSHVRLVFFSTLWTQLHCWMHKTLRSASWLHL